LNIWKEKVADEKVVKVFISHWKKKQFKLQESTRIFLEEKLQELESGDI
jgi:hypothetical protein